MKWSQCVWNAQTLDMLAMYTVCQTFLSMHYGYKAKNAHNLHT